VACTGTALALYHMPKEYSCIRRGDGRKTRKKLQYLVIQSYGSLFMCSLFNGAFSVAKKM
jgi:hypothetical protein